MTESNPESTSPAAASEGKRYAAYDKTFKRFVGGGTHDTRKAASQAAKDRKVESFEVREV